MATVEVIYLPEEGVVFHVTLPFAVGMSVQDALNESHLLEKYPGVDTQNVGIFSEKVSLSHRLSSGDRVEVYRPLLVCPKEKRRNRAKP